MYYSIFDLFKIGIGPSSSHTVGPINAANLFINHIQKVNTINNIKDICIELKGSLAYTAHGHKTIDGLLIGLLGLNLKILILMKLQSFYLKLKIKIKSILINHIK